MRPGQRLGVLCVAAATAIAVLPGTFGGVTRPAVAATAAGSSPVTLSGSGPYSGLKVTVSQTRNLIDQFVEIDWQGGSPTVPAGGAQADYLQIMQCWGDDPAGPDRTQCEFGGLAGTVLALPSLQTTREVYAGASLVDPAETLLPTAANPDADVPFAPVHPNTDPGADNSPGQYYGVQTTNEVPFGRTQSDGTGKVFFETQTTRESPGLGCGEQLTDVSGNVSGRPCWLVVVPRGETEVNGAPYTDQGYGLVTSPLSASNWAHRIVVPLQFEPVGLLCPLGGQEQRTLGQETAEEAVGRWQPALCTQTGTAYGFTPVSDDTARAKLLTKDPGLEFVGAPEPPALVPKGTQIAYAPVAVSGAVIAFNIDVATYRGSPAALRARNGTRVPDINLTQRLVAKLITQSYQLGSPALNPAVSQNQPNLVSDPDFIAANPDLTGLAATSVADVLMPFTSSDAIEQLWRWVSADPAAKAFLAGAPDPWGMTVNPAYRGITDKGPPSDFPKNDAYCQDPVQASTGQTPLCTLDSRPYANDMHDAARSAARGDTLSRAFWDGTATPPAYKKAPAQLTGSRAVMAFTDAATAVRYSLPIAHLRNTAGQFVAPTAAALTAGLAAMKPSGVPGVVVPDPTSTSPAAYPLTSITYAATVPAALSVDSKTALASFLKYAATSGQELGLDVGQLPFGYLPITDAMSWQTLQVATSLITPAVKPTPTTKSPSPRTTTSKPPAKGTKTPSPSVAQTTSALPQQVVQPPPGIPPPATSAAPSAVPSAVVTSAQPTPPPDTPAPRTTSAAAGATPAAPPPAAPAEPVTLVAVATQPVAAGAGRYILLILFVVGALCAFSGPLLLRFASRRSR